MSLFIRNSTLYLSRNHGLVVRQHSLGGEGSGEWDTQAERPGGVGLQLTVCDMLPLQSSTISTRLIHVFPYPRNEDIATELTGHARKSIRKESELPKATWPVTDNFGRPYTLLTHLQKAVWGFKPSQNTWKMSASFPDMDVVPE